MQSAVLVGLSASFVLRVQGHRRQPIAVCREHVKKCGSRSVKPPACRPSWMLSAIEKPSWRRNWQASSRLEQSCAPSLQVTILTGAPCNPYAVQVLCIGRPFSSQVLAPCFVMLYLNSTCFVNVLCLVFAFIRDEILVHRWHVHRFHRRSGSVIAFYTISASLHFLFEVSFKNCLSVWSDTLLVPSVREDRRKFFSESTNVNKILIPLCKGEVHYPPKGPCINRPNHNSKGLHRDVIAPEWIQGSCWAPISLARSHEAVALGGNRTQGLRSSSASAATKRTVSCARCGRSKGQVGLRRCE